MSNIQEKSDLKLRAAQELNLKIVCSPRVKSQPIQLLGPYHMCGPQGKIEAPSWAAFVPAQKLPTRSIFEQRPRLSRALIHDRRPGAFCVGTKPAGAPLEH
jgi:hypothetical protein